MDAQIAYRLQAEQQAKGQQQSIQPYNREEIDCINQPLHTSYQQNRQDPLSAQTRPSKFPDYHQMKRGVEKSQDERQVTRIDIHEKHNIYLKR